MKIGIDVVKIDRIKKLMGSGNLQKIFGENEIEYARKFPHPEQHLAGFYALKEAYFKALGSGIEKMSNLCNVCCFHEENGKPYLMANNCKIASVSISHDDDIATGIVLLEEK